MLQLQRYIENIGNEKLSAEYTPQKRSTSTKFIYAHGCRVYRNMEKSTKMLKRKL